MATKLLFEKNRGYENTKTSSKSTIQADFLLATKCKNGSPYLYTLIFAKYSTEYLAYYVYVHESMTKQVLMRFSDRAFFQ